MSKNKKRKKRSMKPATLKRRSQSSKTVETGDRVNGNALVKKVLLVGAAVTILMILLMYFVMS